MDSKTISPPSQTESPSLQDTLAHYLANSPASSMPGADGMLVEEVVHDYPAAASARAVPGEAELCERHPNLAPQVVAFFFEESARKID